MTTLNDRKHLKGKERVEYFQDRCKYICKQSHIPGINPGPSDGEKGPRTKNAIIEFKKCCGVKHPNTSLDNGLIEHLYDPFNRKNFEARGQWERGLKYREHLRDVHRARLKAAKSGPVGVRALRAAGHQLNKHEVGYNDAPWLRQMENDLPHNRLDWMIPGSPYCGFGVLWSYWAGAKILLPDGMVYTPNIRGYAGRTIGNAHFTLVAPEHAEPGAIVVCDWNPGTGADHVCLARGPMKNGQIPTREFNTSPGNAGSQSNGGGVYDRYRARGFIQCVLNVRHA